MTTRFLKLPELQQRYGVCRKTLEDWESRDQFPRAVRLGAGKLKVWPESVIEEWESRQIAASRAE